MAIHANWKAFLVPVAVISAGILGVSALGATAKVNVSDPSKTSVGPFGTVIIDPNSIPKLACDVLSIGIPGIEAGDHVVVQAPHDLEAGLASYPVTQPTSDALTMKLCNYDNTNAVDGGPKSWAYIVIR